MTRREDRSKGVHPLGCRRKEKGLRTKVETGRGILGPCWKPTTTSVATSCPAAAKLQNPSSWRLIAIPKRGTFWENTLHPNSWEQNPHSQNAVTHLFVAVCAGSICGRAKLGFHGFLAAGLRHSIILRRQETAQLRRSTQRGTLSKHRYGPRSYIALQARPPCISCPEARFLSMRRSASTSFPISTRAFTTVCASEVSTCSCQQAFCVLEFSRLRFLSVKFFKRRRVP